MTWVQGDRDRSPSRERRNSSARAREGKTEKSLPQRTFSFFSLAALTSARLALSSSSFAASSAARLASSRSRCSCFSSLALRADALRRHAPHQSHQQRKGNGGGGQSIRVTWESAAFRMWWHDRPQARFFAGSKVWVALARASVASPIAQERPTTLRHQTPTVVSQSSGGSRIPCTNTRFQRPSPPKLQDFTCQCHPATRQATWWTAGTRPGCQTRRGCTSCASTAIPGVSTSPPTAQARSLRSAS